MSITSILIRTFALTCGLAQQTETVKPVCNAHIRGTIWRERAPDDPCHTVEMCVMNGWKYKWSEVAVSFQQLSMGAQRAKACRSGLLHNLETPLKAEALLDGQRNP